VTQENAENGGWATADGDNGGYGSEFRLFRNLNIPADGAGWASDVESRRS